MKILENKTKEQKRGIMLSLILIAAMLISAFLLREHRGLWMDQVNEWWFGWILTRIIVPLFVPSTAMVAISLISKPLHRIGINMKPHSVAVCLALCIAYMALGAEIYGWFSTFIFLFFFSSSVWAGWQLVSERAPYCPQCHTGLINVDRVETERSEVKRTTHHEYDRYALSPDSPYEESKDKDTAFKILSQENHGKYPGGLLGMLETDLNWIQTHLMYKNVYRETYNHFDQHYNCTCKKCGNQFEKIEPKKELVGYTILESKDVTKEVEQMLKRKIREERERIDRQAKRDAELAPYMHDKPKQSLGNKLGGVFGEFWDEATGRNIVEKDGRTWYGEQKFKTRKMNFWDIFK